MWLENNGYPHDGRVRREALTLVEAGYEVTVVCPRRGDQSRRELIDGVAVARYPEIPGGSGIAGFVIEYLFSMIWTLIVSVGLFFRRRFDVIHAHNPPDTFAVIAIPFKLLGVRFVFDHHDISPEMYDARFGDDAKPVVRRALALMERITFALADHVIATNESYRHIAIDRGRVSPDKVTVVRNGPELERVRATEPDPVLRSRASSIIGYVGEMGPQDGVDHLVRAIGHLVHDMGRTDVLCVIMGSGDALPDLERLVGQLGLEDHVELTGRVSDEHLMAWLSTTDVCVDPDPSNPFNDRCSMIKMSEYMALGKPIVAYDLPEHRVTAGEAASYADANDPAALAKHIGMLLEDEDLRRSMGAIGRTRVLERLAWTHQQPHLLNAYRRLLGPVANLAGPVDSTSAGGHTMEELPEVLPLVRQLSAALAEANVRYCHWKSNEGVERSLRGDNDLDLLIDRADAGRFFEVASRLGFRMAVPPARKRIPGFIGLYGFDAETQRFVQIDAHFQLVLGDDMTKNYRLPFESDYLEQLDTSGFLPLPQPEFEYLLFVIRMTIKHSPWDAQLSYKGRLTASERRELVYLEDRIDADDVETLRSRHLPTVTSELLRRCRLTLGRDLGLFARAAIAHELMGVLKGYDRSNATSDTILKLYRRSSGRLLRLLPWVDQRKRLASGGAVVALVGGDGSGKTTAVGELERFLRRHFAVRRFHLGKPSAAPPVRLVRKLLRRIPHDVRAGMPPWEANRLTSFPGYVYLWSHLLTARERYRTHLAVRRAAGRGAVVVCDRYPLSGLETMDCPRLQNLPGVADRPLAKWMKQRERKYYERITRPDIVIVMRVPPSVAAARRPEQDHEFVRRRAEEIFQHSWSGPGVFVVDTDRPLEDVLSEIRSLVWAVL